MRAEPVPLTRRAHSASRHLFLCCPLQNSPGSRCRRCDLARARLTRSAAAPQCATEFCLCYMLCIGNAAGWWHVDDADNHSSTLLANMACDDVCLRLPCRFSHHIQALQAERDKKVASLFGHVAKVKKEEPVQSPVLTLVPCHLP